MFFYLFRFSKHLNELKNANSGLELRMKLKIEYPAVSHRATHIIATIGSYIIHSIAK